MKLTIYWKTKNREHIARMRKKFSIPEHITVNGETVCEIKEEDLPLLRECENRGVIQIRNKQIKTKRNENLTIKRTESA